MSTVSELVDRARRALDQKDVQRALSYYKKAIRIEPSNQELYIALGYTYGTLKDFKNSKKIGKKLIKMNSESFHVRICSVYLS